MTDRKSLRIFISSPSDVSAEREAAITCIENLARAWRDEVDLQVIAWEREAMLATRGSFQDQIPGSDDVDLVVGILWNRIGYPLDESYTFPGHDEPPTGTTFEILTALEAYRHNGSPDLMLYRKTAPPATGEADADQLTEIADQIRQTDSFVTGLTQRADGTFKAAYTSFDETGKFARLLDQHLTEWLEENVGLIGERTWAGNPYRGLDVFEVEHAPIFHGRDQARAEAMDILQGSDERSGGFLLIVGSSGSGKSSLVRAGILPHLPERCDDQLLQWQVGLTSPGGSTGAVVSGAGHASFANLVAALRQAMPAWQHGYGSDGELANGLAATPALLGPLVAAYLQSQGAGERVALVVDQAEELFDPQAVSPDLREAYVSCLQGLVATDRVWVLMTLRADQYALAQQVQNLVALKQGRQLDLTAPGQAELADIISQPARSAGMRFERGSGGSLNQVIASEAAAFGDCLPLLEFTLAQLYEATVKQSGEEEGRQLITFATYEGLGGIGGAIAAHVTAVEAQLRVALETDPVPVLQKLFPHLVRVDADAAQPSRRRVSIEALVGSDPQLHKAVDVLTAPSSRLLALNAGDDDSATGQVALVHEILLRVWPALTAWLQVWQPLLHKRERLSQQAQDWDAASRSQDLLLGAGLPLLDAQDVAKHLPLSLLSKELVDASARYHEELAEAAELAARKRVRRLQLMAVAGFVLTTIATISGVVAWQQREEARKQKQIAVTALASAEESAASEAAAREIADGERVAAEELTEFMLFDLHDALDPLGRLDLMLPAAKKVLTYYQRKQAHADMDKDAAVGLATALGNLVNLFVQTGDLAAADKCAVESLEIFRRLLDADPENPQLLRDVGTGYGFLSVVEKLRDNRVEAHRHVMKSLEYLRRACELKADKVWLVNISSSLERLAEIERSLGNPDEARAAIQECVEIRQKLHEAHPEDDGKKHALALSYANLGIDALYRGDFGAVEKSYNQAIEICQGLVDKDPKNSLWKRDLAALYGRRGKPCF